MTRMRESITTDDLIATEEERYRPETDGRHSLRTGRRLMEDPNRPQHKKRPTRKCKNKKNR